jgi:hypothetical protein
MGISPYSNPKKTGIKVAGKALIVSTGPHKQQ